MVTVGNFTPVDFISFEPWPQTVYPLTGEFEDWEDCFILYPFGETGDRSKRIISGILVRNLFACQTIKMGLAERRIRHL